jgi:hypothetical protein
MIVNPLALYKKSKTLFSQNAKTLTMPIKTGMLIVFALLALNSVFEWTHTLMLNSRIDSLQHLYPAAERVNYTTYKAEVAKIQNEIVSYKNVFEKSVGEFSVSDNESNREPLINTLTVCIIPIVLLLVLAFHLIESVIVKREDQIERMVDIILLMSCTFLLFRVMIAFSYAIPTFPDGFVWGNYWLNILLSVVLYLLICGVVTSLSERIVEIPQADPHDDVDKVEHSGEDDPEPEPLVDE